MACSAGKGGDPVEIVSDYLAENGIESKLQFNSHMYAIVNTTGNHLTLAEAYRVSASSVVKVRLTLMGVCSSAQGKVNILW